MDVKLSTFNENFLILLLNNICENICDPLIMINSGAALVWAESMAVEKFML